MIRHFQKVERRLHCRYCLSATQLRAAASLQCPSLAPQCAALSGGSSSRSGNYQAEKSASGEENVQQPDGRTSLQKQHVALRPASIQGLITILPRSMSSNLNGSRSGAVLRHAHTCAAAAAPLPSAVVSTEVDQRPSSEMPHSHPPQPLPDSLDRVRLKAQVVFDACWRKLETEASAPLQAPAEVVWLNGAPGSGKGANTPYIMESRGITRAITMSSLLDSSEEIREIKNRGELIPDTVVGDALLNTIFQAGAAPGSGILIDGFPRTALQVDFLKLLFDKLLRLHIEAADTPDEPRFPRPSFKVVVLYVDQEESVRRQMARAKMAALHNLRARDAGTEDLMRRLRATDVDEAKCRARYAVFKEHYGTLLRLKQAFPFSLIDAMGDLATCRAQILRELRYQSSLDLNPMTHSAIRHLPLARDLVRVARQQLVRRLDGYMSKKNAPIFRQVLGIIDDEVVPLLRKCSLAGHAEYKTQNEVFSAHAGAPDMLLDVLSDRGFSGSHIVNERVVPARVDPETWVIINQIDKIHKFRITFQKHGVRESEAYPPAVASEESAIGHTYLPGHLAGISDHAERSSGVPPLGHLPKASEGLDPGTRLSAEEDSVLGKHSPAAGEVPQLAAAAAAETVVDEHMAVEAQVAREEEVERLVEQAQTEFESTQQSVNLSDDVGSVERHLDGSSLEAARI